MRTDCVVLATGATQNWPAPWPIAWKEEGLVADLRQVCADLMIRLPRQRGTAVLYDADHTAGTYAAAELMAELFSRVVIVTPRPQLAMDESLVTRQGIYRRLTRRPNVDVHLLTEACDSDDLIDGGRVVPARL